MSYIVETQPQTTNNSAKKKALQEQGVFNRHNITAEVFLVTKLK